MARKNCRRIRGRRAGEECLPMRSINRARSESVLDRKVAFATADRLGAPSTVTGFYAGEWVIAEQGNFIAVLTLPLKAF